MLFIKTVNIHHAKTHLSALLTEMERGEDIVIARNGTQVARLVRGEQAAKRRAANGGISWSGVISHTIPPYSRR